MQEGGGTPLQDASGSKRGVLFALSPRKGAKRGEYPTSSPTNILTYLHQALLDPAT